MSSLLVPSVPFHRNPQFKPGLDALVAFLMGRGYDNSVVRWSIYDHVAREGTLAGSLIEPEDEDDAESVFVDNLPALSLTSEAWDKPDVFLDAELLVAGVHPLPFGDGPDRFNDAPDADPHCRFPGIASLAERQALPPIAGGSPEAEPTDADRRDFDEWLSQVDRALPPRDLQPAALDAVRSALYGPNPFA